MKHYIKRCPDCHRKRWVYAKGTVNKTEMLYGVAKSRPYYKWQCSKGHSWFTVVGDLNLFNDLLKHTYLPGLSDALNARSVLYATFVR
jgi:hypothetical protein